MCLPPSIAFSKRIINPSESYAQAITSEASSRLISAFEFVYPSAVPINP